MPTIKYFSSYRQLTLVFLTTIAFILAGCQSEESQTEVSFSDSSQVKGEKVYILGVHPLHNPSKLVDVYGPLADYLSQQIPGAKIQVEASKNYPDYDQKIEKEAFDFSLPNPFQTINSLDNDYVVINQVGKSDLFRGLILVRKDSGIDQVKDLQGKKVAYPAPTALAATMMPQLYLQKNGLELTQTETLYVGSQESSMMNVYLKHTSASATWPIPWLDLQRNKPEIAAELKVAWQTSTLPNNSFMYHSKKVPKEVAMKVQLLLSDLHTHEKGQVMLDRMNVDRVYLADNDTYSPVMDFLKEFKVVVGDNHRLAAK